MFIIGSNIIYILVLSFNISLITKVICHEKINKRNLAELTGLVFLFSYMLFSLNHNDLLVPISTLIAVLYLYTVLKNICISVLVSVISEIIFAASDVITGLIFIFFLKIDYSSITANRTIYFLVSIIILILSIIISIITKMLFLKLYETNPLKISKRLASILMIYLVMGLAAVYLYLFIFKYLFARSNNNIILVNSLLLGTFIALLIIITYIHEKKARKDLEREFRDKELSQLKEYTKILEMNTNDLRKFKHDYINILQILGSYLEEGNLDGLKAFYRNELMPESEKIISRDLCFMQLQFIKINPLKGLISSKIIASEMKNIETHIEISEDISHLSVRLIDICRIIGILFDNAIEAAEACDKGFIYFAVVRNNDCTTFILTNSCPENTPPIYKIYEKNFSTKGLRRGIGLKTVREIVNGAYTNIFLNTKIENSAFKQELVIINTSENDY